jgi:hypothetical protein
MEGRIQIHRPERIKAQVVAHLTKSNSVFAQMDMWLMTHKYHLAPQKFRQEDKKLSGSEAFMRRTDSLKRVSSLL